MVEICTHLHQPLHHLRMATLPHRAVTPQLLPDNIRPGCNIVMEGQWEAFSLLIAALQHTCPLFLRWSLTLYVGLFGTSQSPMISCRNGRISPFASPGFDSNTSAFHLSSILRGSASLTWAFWSVGTFTFPVVDIVHWVPFRRSSARTHACKPSTQSETGDTVSHRAMDWCASRCTRDRAASAARTVGHCLAPNWWVLPGPPDNPLPHAGAGPFCHDAPTLQRRALP